MATYEAQYFLETKALTLCLGRRGGQSDFTVGQIITGQAGTLMEELSDAMGEVLSYNPQFQPDLGSTIHVRFNMGERVDDVIIALWLSTTPPRCEMTYDGTKPLKGPGDLQAQTWKLSMGTCFTDYDTNAPRWISKFLQHESTFPSNTFLILQIFRTDMYHTPSLYGYFRPITDDLLPHYTTILQTCPPDCYPIEIRYLTRGWWVWIRKTDWDQKSVRDLIFV